MEITKNSQKDGPTEKQNEKEYRLKDAFNAMGYVNLAIAK
jgi:hypothetical protein